MVTQNLTDYTLILNVKEIFKELLRDKLQSQKVNLINFLPTDKSQLPCLIIYCIDCKVQPVGVGRIIGNKLKDGDRVELGIIEGARLIGSFKFDIWVKKAKDSFEKLDQIANVIINAIGENELALRGKGILSILLEKISDVASSKKNDTWQLEDEAMEKILGYKVLYEGSFVKEPKEERVIKKVEVELKNDFKEKMVIEEKITPTPLPPPLPTPEKVNINTASIDQLIELLLKYNVTNSKELAEEIIKKRKRRKFKKPEDIIKVRGVTEEIFNKIKDVISI